VRLCITGKVQSRGWGCSVVNQLAERARQARATWRGQGQLQLEGPAVEGVAVLLPKTVGLKPGSVLHSARLASMVWESDAEHLVVFADVPGTYDVQQT
jgi:hypothetical protein